MLKVLVVEDEAYGRRGIVLSVDWTALDCFVVGEAANGEEGIAQAEKSRAAARTGDIIAKRALRMCTSPR